MQISRHWRMNGQRYRLQGVLYPFESNIEHEIQAVSLQGRPNGCRPDHYTANANEKLLLALKKPSERAKTKMEK